jgi:hypothetical protein
MPACRFLSRFLCRLFAFRRLRRAGVFGREHAFVLLADPLYELFADRLAIDLWVGHFDIKLIEPAPADAIGLPLLGKALRRRD